MPEIIETDISNVVLFFDCYPGSGPVYCTEAIIYRYSWDFYLDDVVTRLHMEEDYAA